jgi:drug/metabolite transporter (DMT)-like permease
MRAGGGGLRFDDARSDWIVFFACLAMWGSAFAALKIAHDGGISPAWVTAGRMMVACAFLLAILVLTKQRLPPLSNRRAWGVFAIIGVFGTALPFLLFAWASGRADSAVVAICNGGSPFFTSLLAHAFLRDEKLTPNRIVGVGLGFAGLATLAAPAFGAGVNAEALGIAAGVSGAACYGLANVLIKAAPEIKPTTGATMYCLVALAAVAPVALLSGPPPLTAPIESWLGVGALGLFSTALGGMGYVHLVRRRGPVLVSFVTYLIPLWAAAIGMIFLGERPGWTAFIALLLIVAGLVVSQRKSS